jgi:hypothetical protein
LAISYYNLSIIYGKLVCYQVLSVDPPLYLFLNQIDLLMNAKVIALLLLPPVSANFLNNLWLLDYPTIWKQVVPFPLLPVVSTEDGLQMILSCILYLMFYSVFNTNHISIQFLHHWILHLPTIK